MEETKVKLVKIMNKILMLELVLSAQYNILRNQNKIVNKNIKMKILSYHL